MMSRTLDNINVRKGSTTASSHEVVDIFNGMSGYGSGPVGGGGGSIQGQWGTKDMNQQYTTCKPDQGREIRESFSHTTQLSQMYHQLNSYHLGTNRAVFFMLPRPHIVQPKDENGAPILTFVNGPRQLEGVQEFFLVVMRPKEMQDIKLRRIWKRLTL